MTEVRPLRTSTRRQLWRGASVVLTVLVLAACAETGTEGPEATVDRPLSHGDAPERWQEVDRDLVTLYAPGAFGEGKELDPDPRAPDARFFVLDGQTNEHGGMSRVSISVSEAPTRSASVEADAMENELRATSITENRIRTEIAWPGATAAIYLTWDRDVEYDDGAVLRYHHEWFFADLKDDGGQVVVGTAAPVEEYDDLQMHTIMTTITLHP